MSMMINERNQNEFQTPSLNDLSNDKLLALLLAILTVPSFIIGLTFLLGISKIISFAPGLLLPNLTGYFIIYFILGLFFGFGLLITLANILLAIPITYQIIVKHNEKGVDWLKYLAIANLINPIHGTLVSIALLMTINNNKFHVPKITSTNVISLFKIAIIGAIFIILYQLYIFFAVSILKL